MKDSVFRQTVWDFYKKNKRPMPWREDISPYSVFVSEVMLQQTQVSRVLIKYPLFLRAYAGFRSLSSAETFSLLSVWQGMGYNRRALYLRSAAQKIEKEHQGVLPDEPDILDALPGIGHATACSIVAFAYNKPVVFIETNIRRVFIYHYFAHETTINDRDIMPLVERTVDQKNPREWYWALMDYGAYIATLGTNPNKKSRHYTTQKRFEGSVREVRGGILKVLLKESLTLEGLKKIYSDERLSTALEQLLKEGFIKIEGKKYTIK